MYRGENENLIVILCLQTVCFCFCVKTERLKHYKKIRITNHIISASVYIGLPVKIGRGVNTGCDRCFYIAFKKTFFQRMEKVKVKRKLKNILKIFIIYIYIYIYHISFMVVIVLLKGYFC